MLEVSMSIADALLILKWTITPLAQDCHVLQNLNSSRDVERSVIKHGRRDFLATRILALAGLLYSFDAS